MMILGISGSPRKGGNTDILLEKALSGASKQGASVEKVILNELKFSPCQECENIRKDGVCKVKDDMQLVYQKVESADGIILASPIFFGSLSAQTKMMIDRFQCLWLSKYTFKTNRLERSRIGAFICVEASDKRDFFENAKSIVRNFFVTIDAVYTEELLCVGVDRKGAVLEHEDCLRRGFEIGERIASKI
ncbi:MAG TPA: flavodoxin family protein [Candidatus Omnitrophica bacterium]|nr:flavodoxin family protein [Candidatus Omnitrophota bacterium]